MHSKLAFVLLLLLPCATFAQDTGKSINGVQWKVEYFIDKYELDDPDIDTLEYEISFRLKISSDVTLLEEPEITFDQGLVTNRGLRATSTELIFDRTLQVPKKSKLTEISGTIACATGGWSFAKIPEKFKIKLKEKPKE